MPLVYLRHTGRHTGFVVGKLSPDDDDDNNNKTSKCKPTEPSLNNTPAIIIRNNERGTCVLIDVAISGDRNMIKEKTEKILTYENLITQIRRMWNVKVIPVIVRATITIAKPSRQCFSNIPGKHEIKELKKNRHYTHTSGSKGTKHTAHAK